MMLITYFVFTTLGVLCAALQWIAYRANKDPSIGNNPVFLSFQRKFFAAYLIATFADWLQGPYLYKLYSHYGFLESDIAVLYVCGFASSIVFGTLAPIAADRYGRKRLCLSFTIVYSITCLMKLSTNFFMLAIARILGGFATALLFSTFEAWYVHEHIEVHDFPKEWIAVTFNKATSWNGSLAVLAGILANIVAEWMRFGPVSPFILAIPCLIVTGIIVSTMWDDNIAAQPVKFNHSCMSGLKNIVTEPRIFLIGIIQSFFESAMYIFVFLWTPVLDSGNTSLGIVFSSFMICIAIGHAAYQILTSKGIAPMKLLFIAVTMALIGNTVCITVTHRDNVGYRTAFLSFILIEISVGLYFPCMAYLRSKVIPDTERRSVANWFRVPLNLIACTVLLMFHHQANQHGNRLLFGASSCLLGLALICLIKFMSMVRNDDEFNEDDHANQLHMVNIA